MSHNSPLSCYRPPHGQWWLKIVLTNLFCVFAQIMFLQGKLKLFEPQFRSTKQSRATEMWVFTSFCNFLKTKELTESNKFGSSDQNPRETHRSWMACSPMCWKVTPVWMSTWLAWMSQMWPDAPFTSLHLYGLSRRTNITDVLLTCLLSLSLPSAHWCVYCSSCQLQSFAVYSFSLLSPALFVSLFSASLSLSLLVVW